MDAAIRAGTTLLLLASLVPMQVHAANICIDGGDSATLEFWLNTMADNNQDDELRLRAGTFVAPAGGFAFGSSESRSLTISGQWNAGCSSIRGVSDTVIDGAVANRLMRLINDNGDLTVRRVQFANGRRVGDSGSAGLQINGVAGAGRDVTVELNGFFNNADDGVGFDSGSAALSAGTENGVVRIRNNLFLSNAGGMASAAAILINGAASAAYITNNTVVGNGGDGALHGGFRLQVGTAMPDSIVVSNNILWENSSPDLRIDDGAVLFNNDIDSLMGTANVLSAGNLNVDPGFVGGSPPSYRLVPGSPLVNAGLNTPPGGLTLVDFDGATRLRAGTVDMGAYEYGGMIFSDGFE